MSLREEQSAFAKDVIKLLTFIDALGFEISFGEVLRTEEQQKIYLETGKSKTMNSMHLKKCAIDLNIFRDGKLVEGNDLKEFGVFWEGLSPKNRWGGNFVGFSDTPHYQRTV